MSILTPDEGATVLRCDSADPLMLQLLPLVDSTIEGATGRDWSGDVPVHPLAKLAAQMLLVRLHEDPGGMGAGGALSFALTAALTRLEALAGRYWTFAGTNGAGGIWLEGVKAGWTVVSLTGRVGVSSDQSASFESVITADDYIQQVATGDLSANHYTAYLVPPEAM